MYNPLVIGLSMISSMIHHIDMDAHPLEVLEVQASHLTRCVLRGSDAQVIYKLNLNLPRLVSS